MIAFNRRMIYAADKIKALAEFLAKGWMVFFLPFGKPVLQLLFKIKASFTDGNCALSCFCASGSRAVNRRRRAYIGNSFNGCGILELKTHVKSIFKGWFNILICWGNLLINGRRRLICLRGSIEIISDVIICFQRVPNDGYSRIIILSGKAKINEQNTTTKQIF
jgi:hypothetical protein